MSQPSDRTKFPFTNPDHYCPVPSKQKSNNVRQQAKDILDLIDNHFFETSAAKKITMAKISLSLMTHYSVFTYKGIDFKTDGEAFAYANEHDFYSYTLWPDTKEEIRTFEEFKKLLEYLERYYKSELPKLKLDYIFAADRLSLNRPPKKSRIFDLVFGPDGPEESCSGDSQRRLDIATLQRLVNRLQKDTGNVDQNATNKSHADALIKKHPNIFKENSCEIKESAIPPTLKQESKELTVKIISKARFFANQARRHLQQAAIEIMEPSSGEGKSSPPACVSNYHL